MISKIKIDINVGINRHSSVYMLKHNMHNRERVAVRIIHKSLSSDKWYLRRRNNTSRFWPNRCRRRPNSPLRSISYRYMILLYNDTVILYDSNIGLKWNMNKKERKKMNNITRNEWMNDGYYIHYLVKELMILYISYKSSVTSLCTGVVIISYYRNDILYDHHH